MPRTPAPTFPHMGMLSSSSCRTSSRRIRTKVISGCCYPLDNVVTTSPQPRSIAGWHRQVGKEGQYFVILLALLTSRFYFSVSLRDLGTWAAFFDDRSFLRPKASRLPSKTTCPPGWSLLAPGRLFHFSLRCMLTVRVTCAVGPWLSGSLGTAIILNQRRYKIRAMPTVPRSLISSQRKLTSLPILLCPLSSPLFQTFSCLLTAVNPRMSDPFCKFSICNWISARIFIGL